MRTVAAAFVSVLASTVGYIAGLVSIERIALIFSLAALLAAIPALVIVLAMRRQFRNDADKQVAAVDALKESAAGSTRPCAWEADRGPHGMGPRSCRARCTLISTSITVALARKSSAEQTKVQAVTAGVEALNMQMAGWEPLVSNLHIEVQRGLDIIVARDQTIAAKDAAIDAKNTVIETLRAGAGPDPPSGRSNMKNAPTRAIKPVNIRRWLTALVVLIVTMIGGTAAAIGIFVTDAGRTRAGLQRRRGGLPPLQPSSSPPPRPATARPKSRPRSTLPSGCSTAASSRTSRSPRSPARARHHRRPRSRRGSPRR